MKKDTRIIKVIEITDWQINMDLTIWLLLITVLIPIILVAFNKIRMDLAALMIASILCILQLAGFGILGPANTPQDAVKAIAGFSQPVIVTLIALFILTNSLEKSGIPRWIASRLIKIGGNETSTYIGLFTVVSAGLSLLMNNLAAGALLLPSAMEVARRTRIKPSKLLIPVAYGSLLGGSATYFTTANIIVSDLLRIANPPQPGLKFLDFTPTGGLIALAGIIFLWFFGSKLLPDRETSYSQAQAILTGSELEDFYQLGDRLWEAKVRKNSPIIGRTIRESEIGKKWGVAIAAIESGAENFDLPYPDTSLALGDTLFLVGREENIRAMKDLKLEIKPARQGLHLTPRGIFVSELILTPHSQAQGQTLKLIDFRLKYGITVVGIRRLNRSYRTDVGDLSLSFGDSLLVISDEEHLKRVKQSNEFIVIEPNPADQPIRKKQAILSVVAILAAIIASIAGIPVYLATLASALLLLLTNTSSLEESYKAIHWQAVFLIAGMYSVSLAMIQTGLAKDIGQSLLQLVSPLGGLGLAMGAFLLSAFLTQLIGGQVTAMVTGPITIAAAISLGVSPHAVAVATAIGCSASFITPMAHPVNVLMIGPGNYEFKDFARVGWMMTILSILMLMVGLVIFWKL
jgi:di/tricarboxylate transporter